MQTTYWLYEGKKLITGIRADVSASADEVKAKAINEVRLGVWGRTHPMQNPGDKINEIRRSQVTLAGRVIR